MTTYRVAVHRDDRWSMNTTTMVPVQERALPDEAFPFLVLSAGAPEERAAWIRLWEESPGQLPYAHPAVAELMVAPDDELLCAAARTSEGTVFYPVVLRTVDGEARDLISPYGYGGAMCWNSENPMAFAYDFWTCFDDWAREHNVISEFVRASLFDDILPHPGRSRVRSLNFVATIDSDVEVLTACVPKVRQNVRKAIRSGLSMEIDRDGRLGEQFHRIYSGTMKRLGSSEWYRFPPEFFTRLTEGFGDRAVYFAASLDGTPISMDLVLLGRDTAYYFLGGTDVEYSRLRPNDLVKATVMEWLAGHGYRSYVLGGGVAPGDGLERYKKGFAPDGGTRFRTFERVLDGQAYSLRVESRRAEARSRGLEWPADSDFFPRYRSPLPEPAPLSVEGTTAEKVPTVETAEEAASEWAPGQETREFEWERVATSGSDSGVIEQCLASFP